LALICLMLLLVTLMMGSGTAPGNCELAFFTLHGTENSPLLGCTAAVIATLSTPSICMPQLRSCGRRRSSSNVLHGYHDLTSLDLEVAAARFFGEEPAGSLVTVVRYYHPEHLGGPTHVTDSTGELVAHTKFHPYGETASRFGAQAIYGFTGAEMDRESDLGLVRMGARGTVRISVSG